MVDNWLNFILSACIPQSCMLCGTTPRRHTETGLCHDCRQDLPVLGECCLGCGNPLDDTPYQMGNKPYSALIQTRYCGRCLSKPLSLDRCISFFPYHEPFDRIVTNLKFNGQLGNARLLGQLFSDQLAMILDEPGALPDAIIPVPLHASRMQQRGFNQSLEIARPVAKRFGVPLQPSMVLRVQATPPQSSLSLKQRQKNLHGAFRATSAIEFDHVAIIDDVMTSGSTVHALATILKQNGVKTVSAWCMCRARPLAK